jgi:hypothetical protein
MMRKILVALLLATTLFVAGCGCQDDKEVSIPISIDDANNIGSLQIELSYDAVVLHATKVEAEELGKNALIEFNLDNPGLIIIGIVDSSGIRGSGSLVSVSFDVVQKDAQSPIAIEGAKAHDVDTLVDLPMNLTEGGFAAGKVSAPSISFHNQN